MRNKKSQVEDLLSFLFTVIVIFLVALFFSYTQLNKTKALKENANQEISNKDSAILLLTFLRSDMIFEDKNMNVAEALSLYFTTDNKNILVAIKATSEEFFSKSNLASDWDSWLLKISYGEEKYLTIESVKSKDLKLRKEISRTIVPSHHNFRPIEIILYKTSYGELGKRPLA